MYYEDVNTCVINMEYEDYIKIEGLWKQSWPNTNVYRQKARKQQKYKHITMTLLS